MLAIKVGVIKEHDDNNNNNNNSNSKLFSKLNRYKGKESLKIVGSFFTDHIFTDCHFFKYC
jgi:hypothetical protein